jgi:hypothetical protein
MARAQLFLFLVSGSRCNITMMRRPLTYLVSAGHFYVLSCYIPFHGNEDNYILPFNIVQSVGPFSDLSEQYAISNLTIFRNWWSCNAVHLWARSSWFESRPGDQGLFFIYIQFLRANHWKISWFREDRFLPYPFQFILRQLSYRSTLNILDAESALK